MIFADDYYKGIVDLDGKEMHLYRNDTSVIYIDTKFKDIKVDEYETKYVYLVIHAIGDEVDKVHIGKFSTDYMLIQKETNKGPLVKPVNPRLLHIGVRNSFIGYSSRFPICYDDIKIFDKIHVFDNINIFESRRNGIFLPPELPKNVELDFDKGDIFQRLFIIFDLKDDIDKKVIKFNKISNDSANKCFLFIKSEGHSEVEFNRTRVNIDYAKEGSVYTASFKSTKPNSKLSFGSEYFRLKNLDESASKLYSSVVTDGDFIVKGLMLPTISKSECADFITAKFVNTSNILYGVSKGSKMTAPAGLEALHSNPHTIKHISLCDESIVTFNGEDKPYDISGLENTLALKGCNITFTGKYSLGDLDGHIDYANGLISEHNFYLSSKQKPYYPACINLTNHSKTSKISFDEFGSLNIDTSLITKDNFVLEQQVNSKNFPLGVNITNTIFKDRFHVIMCGKTFLNIENSSFNSFDVEVKKEANFDNVEYKDYKAVIDKPYSLENYSEEASSIKDIIGDTRNVLSYSDKNKKTTKKVDFTQF